MVQKFFGSFFSSNLKSKYHIDPKTFSPFFQQTEHVQTLTTDRAKPKIDGGFTCLKQIQTDCEDSSVQVNYYNLCAYLTELKADKIMYKACPTEKCNKMVNDVGPGSFKCEKCRQEFPEFQWRYIVRGAIADATSYQVIMHYVIILI